MFVALIGANNASPIGVYWRSEPLRNGVKETRWSTPIFLEQDVNHAVHYANAKFFC